MSTVTVYSTTTCPYCVLAKNYLKQNNVPFDDVNVGADQLKAMEMVQKSGQMGVPVIDVHGDIIIGYDKPALLAALKKNKLI